MARMTIRDVGYSPGQLPTGQKNSILDVKGKCEFNVLFWWVQVTILTLSRGSRRSGDRW